MKFFLRKNLIKFLAAPVFALAVFLMLSINARADDLDPSWPTINSTPSESVFIVELSKFSTLYEKDADARRYPASTTKILTCLLALEHCSLDETVTFSERAIDLEEAATNIKAEAGEQMSLRDCLYGLMLSSGNDCANAIAEHVSGSIEAFADLMNERAAQIGCTGSHFQNPSGLFGSEHYTTARDMALIAQEAYKNSMFVSIINTYSYSMGPTNMTDEGRTFKNWNELVNPDSENYCPDVIGGKTGYLDESGRCLVTFASKNNLTTIIVQFKGDYYGIFDEAKSLLDFTYNNFTMKNVSSEESRFSYTSDRASMALDTSAQILAIKDRPISDYDSEIIFAEDMDNAEENLYATINYRFAGRELGSANVYKQKAPQIKRASFINVYNVSVLYIIIFLLALIIAICLISMVRTGKKKRRRRRA